MKLKLCPTSLLAIAFGGVMIFAGCKNNSGLMPEPATNQSLSGAENNLDRLTDKRMSRVAASVVVAETAVSKEEPSKSDLAVAKTELKIARAMAGEPSRADLDYANARADKVLASSPEDAKKIISQGIIAAERLKVEIDSANTKYEQEKSKKQAEYEAKLKEKDAEITERKMELEQERISKREERFTLAGIALMTIGILIAFVVPSVIAKKAGLGLTFAGLTIGIIPFIGNEPWFKWVVIAVVSVVVLSSLIKFFLLKPKCEVDTKPKDISSDSSEQSNGNL